MYSLISFTDIISLLREMIDNKDTFLYIFYRWDSVIKYTDTILLCSEMYKPSLWPARYYQLEK